MVPSSWTSLLLFALLVAPGLLFDLLATRRRTGASESTFREISRVVLASTVFSSLGIAGVGLLTLWKPDWMPDPRLVLLESSSYVVDNIGRTLVAVATQLTVSLAAALAAHLFLASRSDAALRSVSAWTRVFRDDAPRGCSIYLRLSLNTGVIVLGRLAHSTASLEWDDREIVLSPPLYSRAAGGALQPVPSGWQRIIIPSSSIQAISVAYQQEPPVEFESDQANPCGTRTARTHKR
jgi:hypothetical protein